ncbi:MAG TPA: M28 family peptidase [Casimicrobiaceae bacterium]|nr:M28 family peptidase [Casimicrobiaceae bacterium]
MSAGVLLGLAVAAIAALLWYMIAVSGDSWSGALPLLRDDEQMLVEPLQKHVETIASSERNLHHPEALASAARYLEQALSSQGYRVASQAIEDHARNLEVELSGRDAGRGIVIVGAHYDSVFGAPGANDNGSGVAAVLELATLLRDWKPRRTWRFVFFVNEEPPYFKTERMGSYAYTQRSRARGESIVAMFSIETIGYFSDSPGSQRYPFPLGLFYPSRGDFLAFVANLGSRTLLHRTIGAFRTHAQFPSEGIAAPAWIPGVDWSDQWAFWRLGVQAVMITDTAPYRYPHYHTMHDTPDKIDYARLARIVRALEQTFREIDGQI